MILASRSTVGSLHRYSRHMCVKEKNSHYLSGHKLSKVAHKHSTIHLVLKIHRHFLNLERCSRCTRSVVGRFARASVLSSNSWSVGASVVRSPLSLRGDWRRGAFTFAGPFRNPSGFLADISRCMATVFVFFYSIKAAIAGMWCLL